MKVRGGEGGGGSQLIKKPHGNQRVRRHGAQLIANLVQHNKWKFAINYKAPSKSPIIEWVLLKINCEHISMCKKKKKKKKEYEDVAPN